MEDQDPDGSRVCTACFGDPDLKRFIRNIGGPRGCSFCGGHSAPTAPTAEVSEFIEERINTFFGRAVEQLPYESREGGYQGWHVNTYELLFEEIGLDLPRDSDGRLERALLDRIDDEAWCEFDWLQLEYHEDLQSYWDSFSRAVKHGRRFFFHKIGRGDDHDPIARSLNEFLSALGHLLDESGLVRTWPGGYRLYRARARQPGVRFETAAELGPPPADVANQSNRMNPPGIPVLYAAESHRLAGAETSGGLLSVGRFIAQRPLRMLDLADLPPVPGFFSDAPRIEVQGLAFLHSFAEQIAAPVARDDRVHVDYIPTQVLTEFLRDFRFEGGPIDGIRYPSATPVKGANMVLFADQDSVYGPGVARGKKAWLRLDGVRHIERKVAP